MNIAIFSPNQNQYSETFILAHKKLLKDKVFYYYGFEDINLENAHIKPGKYKYLILFIYSYLRDWAPFKYILEYKIKKSLRQNKIDAILVEFGTHAYNFRNILRNVRIPVVVHFHGYDASAYEAIENCNYYKEIFQIASKVIAVSKVMKQKLLDLGCPSDKLIVNPCAPSNKFLAIKPQFSKKQFIAIGRFVDKKAPYYLILAFKKVVEKYPDYQLLMAGDGVLLNTCKNLIKYYNLDKNIILLGIIKPEEYMNILSESLAFIQHSITAENGDMEGTPVGVLEASGAGIPIVSTIHAGIPDVVIHKKTGLLCAEHDIDAMADNMIKLIGNKELAIEMGKAGKENIKLNFNMDKHISILQNALENK